MEEDVAREVATLRDLPRAELVARWNKDHGCPPPSGVRKQLLVRSAAWHLQAKRFGGLSATTLRTLRHHHESILSDRSGQTFEDRSDAAEKARRVLKPGARLIRDWNGRSHVVDVIENGFIFEGKVYRSFSKITGIITGAHWSGPRFFGL